MDKGRNTFINAHFSTLWDSLTCFHKNQIDFLLRATEVTFQLFDLLIYLRSHRTGLKVKEGEKNGFVNNLVSWRKFCFRDVFEELYNSIQISEDIIHQLDKKWFVYIEILFQDYVDWIKNMIHEGNISWSKFKLKNIIKFDQVVILSIFSQILMILN